MYMCGQYITDKVRTPTIAGIDEAIRFVRLAHEYPALELLKNLIDIVFRTWVIALIAKATEEDLELSGLLFREHLKRNNVIT